MMRQPIRAAGRMALVQSTSPPRRLWEGPAALDNKENVYTNTHTCIFPAHAFWRLRWRLRLTNRCDRLRFAARRSSRERLAAVENLLANRSSALLQQDPVFAPGAVEIFSHNRPRGDRRQQCLARRVEALFAVPVDKRIEVRFFTVKIVGHQQIGVAVAVQVGRINGHRSVGWQCQVPIPGIPFVIGPVEAQRNRLVVVLWATHRQVKISVVVVIPQINQAHGAVGSNIGVDTSVNQRAFAEIR